MCSQGVILILPYCCGSPCSWGFGELEVSANCTGKGDGKVHQESKLNRMAQQDFTSELEGFCMLVDRCSPEKVV